MHLIMGHTLYLTFWDLLGVTSSCGSRSNYQGSCLWGDTCRFSVKTGLASSDWGRRAASPSKDDSAEFRGSVSPASSPPAHPFVRIVELRFVHFSVYKIYIRKRIVKRCLVILRWGGACLYSSMTNITVLIMAEPGRWVCRFSL